MFLQALFALKDGVSRRLSASSLYQRSATNLSGRAA